MAFNYNKKVWSIDKEEVKNLPPMDVWRDTDGNEIDFEAELAKGHTGFLYMVYFPNGQLYPGSKKIVLKGSNNVFVYYGSGKLGGEYVDEHGTNGIRREVLEFHSGTVDELHFEEEIFLKETNVVADDKYLNMTDAAGNIRMPEYRGGEVFGEIVATDLKGNRHYFKNEFHAAEGLEKIVSAGNRKIFRNEISDYLVRMWLTGMSMSYEKFLKDIRLVGSSIVEDVELDNKREKCREKSKEISEAQKKSYAENPDRGRKISESLRKTYKENPEIGKRKSENMKKLFENESELREVYSEIHKQLCIDRPELREVYSEAQKKSHAADPERGKKQGEKLKKHYEDPENRKKLSDAQLKSFAENPERSENLSKIHKKRFEDPLERQKASERAKKVFEDNPDMKRKIGDGVKRAFEKNPDLHRVWSEAQLRLHAENPHLAEERSKKAKERYATDPSLAQECSERMKKMFEDDPSMNEKWSKAASQTYKDRPEKAKNHSEKMKKEGTIYFKDGRVENFKGYEEGAKIAKSSKNSLSYWLGGRTKAFLEYGIIKIEFNGYAVEWDIDNSRVIKYKLE